jgi:hypothetical protein
LARQTRAVVLHIATNTDPGMVMTDTDVVDSTWQVNVDSVGDLRIRACNDLVTAATTAYLITRTAGTNTIGEHRWFTGVGGERMRLMESGNFGIGDTNPVDARLTVKGATGAFTRTALLQAASVADGGDWARLDIRGADLVNGEEFLIYQNSAGSAAVRNNFDGSTLQIIQDGLGEIRNNINNVTVFRLQGASNGRGIFTSLAGLAENQIVIDPGRSNDAAQAVWSNSASTPFEIGLLNGSNTADLTIYSQGTGRVRFITGNVVRGWISERIEGFRRPLVQIVNSTDYVTGSLAQGTTRWIEPGGALAPETDYFDNVTGQPTRIEVKKAGRYRVAARYTFQGSVNSRASCYMVVRINGLITLSRGTIVGYTRGTVYGPATAGIDTAIGLSAGDYIELGFVVDDSDATNTYTLLAAHSQLTLEMIS